jgi:hypothetical protein
MDNINKFKNELCELLKKYDATIDYDNESSYDLPSGSMIVYFKNGTESKLNNGCSYVDSTDLKNNIEG